MSEPKPQSRKRARRILAQMPNRLESDMRINCVLQNSQMFKETKDVLFYAALPSEINLDRSIQRALQLGKNVYLPRCKGQTELEIVQIKSLEQVQTGAFGIREPVGLPCDIVCTDSLLVYCPGLAFDLTGGRLGKGMGYYDRFLKNVCAVRVGVCYNETIFKELALQENDIKMHYLLSQTSLIKI